MRIFRRGPGQVACEFEPAEVDLLEGMLSQLIELLLDGRPGATGPGTRRLHTDLEDDDVFTRLEREIHLDSGDSFNVEAGIDPVLARLFPDPYPQDPVASHDFHRFTRGALVDDKVDAARTMLADLHVSRGEGRCAVPGPHTSAWLKSLTNVRLALSVRMDLRDVDDAEYLSELPDDDPRSWTYAIYEWVGWVQESLLAAQSL